MSGREVAVVALGDLVTDVVAQLSVPVRHGDDAAARITTHGGGSSANTAAWLAQLGVPTAFVGRVGADAWGTAAVQVLAGAGVDVRCARDPHAPTGTVIVLVDADGERTMVSDTGAGARLSVEDVDPSLFAPGRWLHVSGYTLLNEGSRPAVLAAVELARVRAMRVSVDPGAAGPITEVGPARVVEWLRGVDVLLPNDDEARALTGLEDPEQAALTLGQVAGEVVVKCNASGQIWSDGTSVVRGTAERATVVDTTGAGDAFAAGFLAARIAGDAPAAALAAGSRVAARAVTVVGGRPPDAG